MAPIDDSNSVICDADIQRIYDSFASAPGNPDEGHRSGLRALYERGLEFGELAAWRDGNAAGKGRIIFLHQSPFDEQIPVMMDHIGAVHHDPNADRGSLVAVDGINIPVDEELLEVLQLMMKR